MMLKPLKLGRIQRGFLRKVVIEYGGKWDNLSRDYRRLCESLTERKLLAPFVTGRRKQGAITTEGTLVYRATKAGIEVAKMIEAEMRIARKS